MKLGKRRLVPKKRDAARRVSTFEVSTELVHPAIGGRLQRADVLDDRFGPRIVALSVTVRVVSINDYLRISRVAIYSLVNLRSQNATSKSI